MVRKILITDNVHAMIIDQFQKWGFVVDFMPEICMSEVMDIIDQYEGLIINSKIGVDKSLIDTAVNLRFIGRVGSGMEHVDIAYCKAQKIECFRSPEGNCNAVAEHIIGMLLALVNNIGRAHIQLRNGKWHREENRGVELRGKTLGIIGFGYTGRALAKKISGFDMEIIAYDKYKSGFGNKEVKEVGLEEIKKSADIISFHVPLTTETRHYLNSHFINDCKKKPIVVNTSRGGIMNTNDVLNALNSKAISGLCIDVFEDEPLDNGKMNEYVVYEQLIGHKNVIATPHIAGWTNESKELLAQVLLNKIGAFLNTK